MKQIEHDIFIAMSAGCETSERITEYVFNEEAQSKTKGTVTDTLSYIRYQEHLRQIVWELRKLEKKGLVYHADDRGTTVWRWIK